MTIHHFREEDFADIKRRLPPGIWERIKHLPYSEDANEDFDELFNRAGITPSERRALLDYKSISAESIQQYLRDRRVQKATALNQPLPITESYYKWSNSRRVQPLDSLIAKNKIPDELSGQTLYRGARIDYGTALIKSGKKTGDTIRDPRYQSFSVNPGTAMYHTSKSQFGDSWDPDDNFKRKRKVLLEHIARGGETGIYGGPEDTELEVIYPRNKQWKITNVRNEDVTYSIRSGEESEEGLQNARIYTIERKNKKLVGKKIVKRKVVKRVKSPVKPIKKIKSKIIRKPVKKCKCKK